jgi:hypothetical protein
MKRIVWEYIILPLTGLRQAHTVDLNRWLGGLGARQRG